MMMAIRPQGGRYGDGSDDRCLVMPVYPVVNKVGWIGVVVDVVGVGIGVVAVAGSLPR